MEEKTKNIKEFDVIALLGRVLKEKKLLTGFIGVFMIMGIIYALNKQKSYTATVILAPEATSMGMSQSLSDIAGMVGLDIGGGGKSVDAIYPEIYPEVFASSDFITKLFDIQVKPTDSLRTKTYYQHLKTDVKVPFWDKPKYWLIALLAKKEDKTGHSGKELDPQHLTKEQDAICNVIRKSIGCQLNKGTSLITITVTDVDPHVSAAIADTLQNRLQAYITLYRTQKARNDLAYAKKLNTEARGAYVKARQIYGAYADANTDLLLESYKAKLEDLENEMQLKYNNYQQTALQVQQAQAKVQENTPAFTVIQQAVVPIQASSTPRSMMVLGFMVLGILCDAAWVLFVRDWAHKFTKHKKSE